MRSKKVILDTNIWISFLITENFKVIDHLLFTGKIKLIFSNESIEEFLNVAKRPKFRKYFSDNNIEDLLKLFDEYGKLVNVSSIVTACRDSKDNFLLSLAIDGNADFLISGDADLLALKKISKTKIITLSDFVKEYK